METIRVVLDTNVVVSAHLNSQGYERYALDLVLAGKLRLFVSPEIFAEYEGGLHRPKFAIAPKLITKSLRQLRSVAKIVEPQRRLNVTRHEPDNRFLECAEAAQADFLVTGNKRHFPAAWRQTLIVNARELTEGIVADLQR